MARNYTEDNARIVNALKNGAPYLFIQGGGNDDRHALVQVGNDRIPLKTLCRLLRELEGEFSLEVLKRMLGRSPVQVLNRHTIVCLTREEFAREIKPYLQGPRPGDYVLRKTDAGVMFQLREGKRGTNPSLFLFWTNERNLRTLIDELRAG